MVEIERGKRRMDKSNPTGIPNRYFIKDFHVRSSLSLRTILIDQIQIVFRRTPMIIEIMFNMTNSFL